MSEKKDHDISHPIASGLAALYLKEALEKGKTIEIPSLGIEIIPDQVKVKKE